MPETSVHLPINTSAFRHALIQVDIAILDLKVAARLHGTPRIVTWGELFAAIRRRGDDESFLCSKPGP